MRTLLEEILMEEYPSSELHECNCGCNECKKDMELNLEFFLEELEYQTNITNTPTPGAYYQIKRGDNLIKVVGTAYKVGEGNERLKLAQMVNNNYINQKFWRKPGNEFEKKHFSSGVISFNPKFNCGEEQRATQKGEKKCYARIWIPIDRESIIVNPNLDPLVKSSCGKDAKSKDIKLTKLPIKKSDKLSVLVRGTTRSSVEQVDWLIDQFNEYPIDEVDHILLLESLKTIMPSVDLTVDILKNQMWGDSKITNMEKEIKGQLRNYIGNYSGCLASTFRKKHYLWS